MADQFNNHTPLPWKYTMFTRVDGAEIQTVEDVIGALTHSARGGESELWGIAIDEVDDEGRSKVICYTGNGPHSNANAQFAAHVVNTYYQREAALRKCVEALEAIATRSRIELDAHAGPIGDIQRGHIAIKDIADAALAAAKEVLSE